MMKKFIFNIYYIIIPVLIVGISLGYSTFALTILSLLPLFIMTNRHTLGIFLLMYGGALAGVVRDVYPLLPIYGVMFDFLGIILVWDLVKSLFRNNLSGIGALLLVFAVFGFFYSIGPQTDFARNKLTALYTHGFYMLIGYYVFDCSKKVDVEVLTRLLLISSICMYAYAIKACSLQPGNLTDYNWFRTQYIAFGQINNDAKGGVVDYQTIGMMVLFSAAIFMSQNKLKIVPTLFYLVSATQLVMVSGCRQAIFGLALIIALRLIIFKPSSTRKNVLSRVFWIAIGSLVAYYVIMLFFQKAQSDIITQTLNMGDEGRMVIFHEALSIFRDNPLFGSGLGGFNAITGEPWPHNFVLELLCETGIIGLIIALLLLIIPLIKKRQGLMHITASNQFLFLILAAIFIRVMVSGDFRISIELFSAVFAIKAAKSITLDRIKPVVNNQ